MIHEITPKVPPLVAKGKKINTYMKYINNKFTKILERFPGGEGKRRVGIAQERQQAMGKHRPGQAVPGTSRRATKGEAKTPLVNLRAPENLKFSRYHQRELQTTAGRFSAPAAALPERGITVPRKGHPHHGRDQRDSA